MKQCTFSLIIVLILHLSAIIAGQPPEDTLQSEAFEEESRNNVSSAVVSDQEDTPQPGDSFYEMHEAFLMYLNEKYSDPALRKYLEMLTPHEEELGRVHLLLLYTAKNIVITGKVQEIGDNRAFLEAAKKFEPTMQIEGIPEIHYSKNMDKIIYHEQLFHSFVEFIQTKCQSPDRETIILYRPIRFEGQDADSYLCITLDGSEYVLDEKPDMPCFQYTEEKMDASFMSRLIAWTKKQIAHVFTRER